MVTKVYTARGCADADMSLSGRRPLADNASSSEALPHKTLHDMPLTFPENLVPLAEQVQNDVYAQPQRCIEAARELLKTCHEPEQLTYLYESLGFAHLILGEHRLSCLFYEQAKTLAPQEVYVLANLAHAQYELGQHDEAIQNGKAALQLKDQQACQNPDFPAETLQPPYHGPKNLIAFSLYGNNPRYCEMAVLNVLAAKRHLPDFACRFYLDSSVPPNLVARLSALGAECIRLTQQEASSIPATFWRFWAMDDPQTNCVLVRDVDALIDAKEAWCVRDWQASGQAFHIIRDDCCHTELILAGLFGIRSGVLLNIPARIQAFLQAAGPAGWKRYGDQLFLRHAIWPSVREHALTHDTLYGYGKLRHLVEYVPSEESGPHNAFVGANYANYQMNFTLKESLQPGTPLYLILKDAAGVLVCCYALQKDENGGPNSWSVFLPSLYRPTIERGDWEYALSPDPQHQANVGKGSIDPAVLGMLTT